MKNQTQMVNQTTNNSNDYHLLLESNLWNIISSQSNQNFIGIKLGDVNESYR